MKARVTDQGVVIPKSMLEGIEEVDIRQEQDMILIVPVTKYDPIFELGENPVDDDITDASENHDLYIYGR